MQIKLCTVFLLFFCVSCNGEPKAIEDKKRTRTRNNRHGHIKQEDCQAGWYREGMSCYKFFPEVGNFKRSEAVCVEQNAIITSISSYTENSIIANISNKLIWIGLNKDEKQTFLWIDSTPLNFTNWLIYRPNNAGNCVKMINGGQWVDCSCQYHLSVVCKKVLEHVDESISDFHFLNIIITPTILVMMMSFVVVKLLIKSCQEVETGRRLSKQIEEIDESHRNSTKNIVNKILADKTKKNYYQHPSLVSHHAVFKDKKADKKSKKNDENGSVNTTTKLSSTKGSKKDIFFVSSFNEKNQNITNNKQKHDSAFYVHDEHNRMQMISKHLDAMPVTSINTFVHNSISFNKNKIIDPLNRQSVATVISFSELEHDSVQHDSDSDESVKGDIKTIIRSDVIKNAISYIDDPEFEASYRTEVVDDYVQVSIM